MADGPKFWIRCRRPAFLSILVAYKWFKIYRHLPSCGVNVTSNCNSWLFWHQYSTTEVPLTWSMYLVDRRMEYMYGHCVVKHRKKFSWDPHVTDTCMGYLTRALAARDSWRCTLGFRSIVMWTCKCVYNLGVSPSLVSRYCEGYSFWSTWGPYIWNFRRLGGKIEVVLSLPFWLSQQLNVLN